MKSNQSSQGLLSRRDFLRIAVRFVGAFVAVEAASSYYSLMLEPGWLDVVHVNIPLNNLPRPFYGYRIAHISDIHIGGWMNRDRLASVIRTVKESSPDLVVITGDHLFGHSWSDSLYSAIDEYVAEMSSLTSEFSVVAVLGNHDHWTNAAKAREMLDRSKVFELNNDVFIVEKGGEKLHIAGVDDVWTGFNRLEDVLAKIPESSAAILLAHEPDYADVSAETRRFGLQLSGHSHGGQVILPIFGPLFRPHLGAKYHSGMYKVHDMWQYTNRGVGMVEPAIRFNCRPEVTVFTLMQV